MQTKTIKLTGFNKTSAKNTVKTTKFTPVLRRVIAGLKSVETRKANYSY